MNKQETLQKLREIVPRQYIKKLNKGGSSIDYIAWFDIATLLDDRTDYWQWEITNLTTTDKRIFMVGKLTIFCDDGELMQSATATEELNCSSYGDPSSNAEAMAMRRASAKFGLARYLWSKEEIHKSSNNNVTPIKNPNCKVIGKPKFG